MTPIRIVHAMTGFVVKAPHSDLTSHGHPRTRVRIGQHQLAPNGQTSYHDLIAYRETANLAALLKPGDDIIATGHTRPFTGRPRPGRPEEEEFQAAAIARLITPSRLPRVRTESIDG